tara:strand:+ start:589 stop:1881 length:1293 start_codon:yes stop_codon:yes gene_type:complete
MSFKGSNKLGARETFVSRTFYNCYAYSDDGTPNVNPSLTQNYHFLEKQLYGKVNQYLYVIEPDYRKMINISANLAQPIMVLDFVADAFKKVQQTFKHAIDREEILSGTPLGDSRSGINATMGATDTSNNYKMHIQAINANFLEGYIDESKKSKIRSFETFFPFYMDYLKQLTPDVPFTRTAYISSVFNSPMNAGLCIEVAQYDHDTDKEKYELFLQSKNFKFYQITAAENGFIIDKNAPWRLIADIGTNSRMMDYAANRNSSLTTVDSVLSYYYKTVYGEEMSDFKRSIVSAYNAFARANPVFYDKEHSLNCKTTKIVQPQIENIRSITSRLNDSFWLEHYINIRNQESKLNYSQASLNRITKNARELRKELDLRKSLGYIDRKFSAFMHHEGSLFYETSKINLIEREKSPASLSKEVKQTVRAGKTKVY